MIDAMRLVGFSVADTAKTAERTIAVLQFFVIGVVAGTLFFAVFRLRGVRPDLLTGLVAGALVGLPTIAISVAITDSTVQPVLAVLWHLALFVAWGAAPPYCLRLLEHEQSVPQPVRHLGYRKGDHNKVHILTVQGQWAHG